MTQYNTLNVKFSNSKLKKWTLGIKSSIGVTLNLLSNLVVYSNDETNFPHKLLLANTQVLRHYRAFGSTVKSSTVKSRISFFRFFTISWKNNIWRFWENNGLS